MTNPARAMLLRTFGRPQGVLGRLGGLVMAHMNAGFGAWIGDLLEVGPRDRVLEVGCGPGAVLRHLSGLAEHVSGVDVSTVMVEQARARNKAGIEDGRVAVLLGSVDDLPFGKGSFDKALAVNSMQVWRDAVAGLCEMRRVLRSRGRLALGFTRHSGQPVDGLTELLTAAGFAQNPSLRSRRRLTESAKDSGHYLLPRSGQRRQRLESKNRHPIGMTAFFWLRGHATGVICRNCPQSFCQPAYHNKCLKCLGKTTLQDSETSF